MISLLLVDDQVRVETINNLLCDLKDLKLNV